MTWCADTKRDGFRWRCRRSVVVCSESKSIKHGSWFQHTNLTFQVMFLTYDMVRREPAYLIKNEHCFSSNTLGLGPVLQRPCSCSWRAALRSAVLTRPSRSTRASSESANTAGATLLRGSGCLAAMSESPVKRFSFPFRTELPKL